MAVVLRHIQVTGARMDEIELATGVAVIAGRGTAATGRHFPLSVCFLHEIVRLLLKGHERSMLLYRNAVARPIRRGTANATHLG